MTRPTGEDEMSNETKAPQPPAEAQPVAWQFQDREGKWHGFMDERHRQNTIADGSWPVRALYAAPPSVLVGVEAKDSEIEALRVRADAMAGEAIKHEARAERLAEALRELVALGHPRDPAIIAAKNALRDHDQEVGNG